VENSNFLLTTARGNFILTLYEKRVAPETAVFHRADGFIWRIRASPVQPRCGRAMARRTPAVRRPAAIVTFLNGHVAAPHRAVALCSLGGALAGLHRAGGLVAKRRPNDLAVVGWRRLYKYARRAPASCSKGSLPELGDELAFPRSGMAAGFADRRYSWPICFPTTCSSATATYRG